MRVCNLARLAGAVEAGSLLITSAWVLVNQYVKERLWLLMTFIVPVQPTG
jgi:hypothetical protein